MSAAVIPASTRSEFRTDIQALRGLAIILVVLYHAKLDFLKAGYLGVDIFFVVSGYLITRIIQKNVELGTFSFAGFYFRRAKRLLPAAYVTFLLTTVLSGVFLTSMEMRDFVRQLIGAVTFTGNIALWLQTGYFEGAAHLKPLLHVWSLAIEEQYYLLLPAALVLVPRRFWTQGTVVLLVVSLILCLVMAPLKPGATFYLLPTRGWELAIGSLGALALDRAKPSSAVLHLFWPAMAALIAVPSFPTGAPHPGIDAAIVCTATLVIILRRHPAFERIGISRYLAKVGDFSYSLYLVHWPLFAFASNAYVSEVPATVRAGLVAASLLSGYLLYRYVELPVRQANITLSRRVMAVTISASLALVVLALGIAKAYEPKIDYAYARRGNHGFGLACEFEAGFTPKADCRNSAEPTVLVWGDSYAMHLVPGIVASTNYGIVQATKTVCGPLIGLAPFDTHDYQRPFAERCLHFNQSVLDYLTTAKSIKVVVLSSPFEQYLEKSAWGGRGFRALYIDDGKLLERDPDMSETIKTMRETVQKIRSLGKRVVIVAPPPSSDFNIGTCLERKAAGKLIFGSNPECQIFVSSYHRQQALVLELLTRVSHEAEVDVVSFDEFLCSEQACLAEMEGVFLYRDWGHFTHDGSRLVGEKMGLAGRLLASAK